MAYLILAVFPAALIAAAINDITSFKIPNWISVLLISAFPVAAVATGTDFSFLWQGALLAVGMLIVGFALFAFKIAGGGDGKLLAAVAPWVGFEFLMPFLMVTALAGGAMAIAILMFRQSPIMPFYGRVPWLMEIHQSKSGIPYGVAIAVGGLTTFSETALFSAAFGG
ncbi:MAG: prepilin peptidase [Pseudomonadota bacterium]